MTSVIALLCAIELPSEQCDRTTAADVIPLPSVENDMACILGAQQTLAQLSIRADAEHRWIIRCSPDHGENVTGVNDP